MATTAYVPPNSERLSFTIFIAALIHALLIFGVTFKLSLNKTASPNLEITLATHQADDAPEDADYLAQSNQSGSGTADEPKQLTTEKIAEFDSTEIQEVREAQIARTQANPSEQEIITTTGRSDRATFNEPVDQPQAEQPVQGDSEQTIPVSEQIASLKAKLDKQREAYAKRPRVRRLTSVAAKASADAAYLYQWSQKVEYLGNRNFPQQALDQGLSGSLRLLTVIDKDGTLVSAEILHSSGYRILDDAAIQIVHLASPFAPFPAEIAESADRLEIIRTWNFEIDKLSTGG